MLRLLALMLFIHAGPVWSWNSGTHRLIAHIAWQELSTSAKSAVSKVLQRHPEYARWTEGAPEKEKAWVAFVEAATWADEIRHDPRYYDEFSKLSTTFVHGLPDTERHRHWHYTDRQIDGSTREGRGSLDTELPRLIKLLGNPASSPAEKTYALPWVVHLVGDAHQPLHVGSRHDKGGNQFEVEDPVNLRRPVSSLHRWWDDIAAPSWLRGKALDQAAQRLLRHYSAPPVQGDPKLWLRESFTLAREYAYPDGRLISIEFRFQAKDRANRRVVEAGHRLGKLLQSVFLGVSRETASE